MKNTKKNIESDKDLYVTLQKKITRFYCSYVSISSIKCYVTYYKQIYALIKPVRIILKKKSTQVHLVRCLCVLNIFFYILF